MHHSGRLRFLKVTQFVRCESMIISIVDAKQFSLCTFRFAVRLNRKAERTTSEMESLAPRGHQMTFIRAKCECIVCDIKRRTHIQLVIALRTRPIKIERPSELSSAPRLAFRFAPRRNVKCGAACATQAKYEHRLFAALNFKAKIQYFLFALHFSPSRLVSTRVSSRFFN